MISSLLVVVALTATTAHASCCYSLIPTRVDASTYDFDMTATSTKGRDLAYRYQIQMQFPAEYITTINAPTSSQAFNCAAGLGNLYSCTTTDTPVFHFKWRITSPGSFTGTPRVDKFTVYNEACQVSPGPCGSTVSTTSSAANGTNSTATPPQNTDGTVDMGALGRIPNTTFYPILAGIIVTVLGVGYLAYKRSPAATRNQNPDDVERQMTAGGNGSGWFGEKKENNKVYNATVRVPLQDAETANANGYAPFSAANPNRKLPVNSAVTAAAVTSPTRTKSTTRKQHQHRQQPQHSADSLGGGLGSGVTDYNRASMMPQGSLLLPMESNNSSHSNSKSASLNRQKSRRARQGADPAAADLSRSRSKQRRHVKPTVDNESDPSSSSSSSDSDDSDEAQDRRRVVKNKRASPRPASRGASDPAKSSRPSTAGAAGKPRKSRRAPAKAPLVQF